jgi:TRIAD3 protein (E3 ubiquitin-protein ligase RNF216)
VSQIVHSGFSGMLHILITHSREILSQEFTTIPLSFIDPAMRQSAGRLWSTYMALRKSQMACEQGSPPYNKIKPRRAASMFTDTYIQNALDLDIDQEANAILVELRQVRVAVAEEDRLLQEERDLEAAEVANFVEAQEAGTLVECGCCSDDIPLNRALHCNAETTHFFCKGCMVRLAEHTVGDGKYSLECMSTDGCIGGYSQSQR